MSEPHKCLTLRLGGPGAGALTLGGALLCWKPEVTLDIEAGFAKFDAFGFEEFALEAGVRFADEEFAARANDAVPGNAFAGGRRGHRAACGAATTGKAQSFSEGSISNNPAAGNLFHEAINGIPDGHFRPRFAAPRQIQQKRGEMLAAGAEAFKRKCAPRCYIK